MSNPLPSINDFNPGLEPVGPRVLVWPIPTEEKSAGGIVLMQSLTEREDMAQIRAIVVDLGAEAFEDVTSFWANHGDHVLIAKYAGLFWTGKDGRKYRVINDADIVARILVDEPCDQVLTPAGITSQENVHGC